MKLRLTSRALTDLENIADYTRAHSPRGAVRVESAVLAAFRTLLMFPRAGRRQDVPSVRKFTTRRYGYTSIIVSRTRDQRSLF